MARLFDELQRRNVFRIGAAYLAVAWLSLQIIDVLKDILRLPDWVGPYSILVLASGFPVALLLAWAFELIPERSGSTEDAKSPKPSSRFGGRTIDFVIMGALSMVVILLVFKDTILPPALLDDGNPPQVRSYTQLTKSHVIFPPYPSPFPLVADDSRLYFSDWSMGQLGMVQLSQAGGEIVRMDDPFAETDAQVLHGLSPDRRSILLTNFMALTADLEFKLWLLPVVGGAPRFLGEGTDGVYSPDGTNLLYTDGYDDVYLANADMSDPRKLVTAPGKVHWTQFSPDGRRVRMLVYGLAERPAIWEISVDGGVLHRLLPQWETIDHCCGSWTPDGKYYVFQATHDYRTQLWAIREADSEAGMEQSEPVQITTGALDFRRPTVVRDGRRIFAIGWQLRGEVVRFDSTDNEFVTLPGFESTSAEWLSYSQDGKRVAFVSYPEGELWRSEVDGSNRVRLTDPPMRAAEPNCRRMVDSLPFRASCRTRHGKAISYLRTVARPGRSLPTMGRKRRRHGLPIPSTWHSRVREIKDFSYSRSQRERSRKLQARKASPGRNGLPTAVTSLLTVGVPCVCSISNPKAVSCSWKACRSAITSGAATADMSI